VRVYAGKKAERRESLCEREKNTESDSELFLDLLPYVRREQRGKSDTQKKKKEKQGICTVPG
jgi:hypothetical protein